MENTDFDKRAKEHWEYIKELLIAHGESEEVVEKIGFHYITAMKHGYRHGLEDRGTHKWKVVKPRRARIRRVIKEKVEEVPTTSKASTLSANEFI